MHREGINGSKMSAQFSSDYDVARAELSSCLNMYSEIFGMNKVFKGNRFLSTRIIWRSNGQFLVCLCFK